MTLTPLVTFPLPHTHTLLHCVLLAPDLTGVVAALGAVVFGHIVGHPVDFGCPALSQGLVKLLTELLQCLFVRLTQSQGVLRREGVEKRGRISHEGRRMEKLYVRR